MILNLIILIFGVFFCSTAVVMIKISQLDTIFLAGMRQLVAGLILMPIFIHHYKRSPVPIKAFKQTLLPGIFLGLHFITWIWGARMTPAANSTLIVNLVPVVMPFLLFFMLQEKVTKVEVWATLLSLAGMFLLTSVDFRLSSDFFLGDMLCLVSMLFLSVYLALAKHNRHFSSIWLYLVPLYWVGGIFCLIIAMMYLKEVPPVTFKEIGLVLGLAVLPTIFGHSSLNYAMKHMRGQVVSLLNMGQFLFAGVLAYVFFNEIPDLLFYPACFLLIVGAVIAIWKHPQDR